jgi:hypothetical protein
MLPADLAAAEAETLIALGSALGSEAKGRWTVEWRFQGLRLLAPVLRLLEALIEAGHDGRLLCADMGATALARRDAPALAGRIASFGDQLRRQQPSLGQDSPEQEMPSQELLLLLGASQAEYEQVEQICAGHDGPVVLVNASLEDGAVGIGSVARQRRRGFLAGLQGAYALIPQAGSALRFAHPGPWELYRLDADGYRLAASFEQRPDAEQQAEALSDGSAAGLGAGLRALDQLIEGLQN